VSDSEIPSNVSLRVVIAEDSGLLREGLARLLADADLKVVAKVGDGPDLISAAEKHRPDIAVVDVRMLPSKPVGAYPTSQCSCSRSTSRSATAPSCSSRD
jgi:DNA-binding NarL/FixJ family response regulator